MISSLAKREQDKLNFSPQDAFIQTDWWLSGKWQFGFLLKVPFSFLQNGWHFCDTVRNFSLYLAIAILLGHWWYAIIIYAGAGIIFELLYKIKQ